LDKLDGTVIAEVEIPKGTEWNVVKSSLSEFQPGIHNLVILLKNNMNVEIDWISFE
jgi:hypothetical protein